MGISNPICTASGSRKLSTLGLPTEMNRVRYRGKNSSRKYPWSA